jgi:hypothetical protein
MLSASVTEFIAHMPGFFKIWHEREGSWLVIVCVSIAVRPGDRLFRPAAELLARLDLALVGDEFVPDPSMLMGRARLLTYAVEPPDELCPAPAVWTHEVRAA